MKNVILFYSEWVYNNSMKPPTATWAFQKTHFRLLEISESPAHGFAIIEFAKLVLKQRYNLSCLVRAHQDCDHQKASEGGV
jgi:hypothetical protein